MTTANRQTGWLDGEFHDSFLRHLDQLIERYGVAVPAYCLMPDHLHIMAAGLREGCDQTLWVRALRRKINDSLKDARLQKQAYDHILRPHETGPDAFTALARYIAENPVRAGLSASPTDWPYVGSSVPALPELDARTPDFRERWWTYWSTLES